MGIENAITKIGTKILTQARKSYVKPSVDVHSIKSIESYGLKLEQLVCDECNFSRVINLEKFYKKLIGDGIGLFHKPELKQAFGEKVKSSNIKLEELEQIMKEVRTPKEIEKGKEYSFEFINLTNPTRNGFAYNGSSIARPLDFREAEFALKKNYSPQEISELANVREHLINGKRIGIEDADVIIKNKMNENTMERFVSLRQQKGFVSDKALFGSYLKESEIETITNKEISKFLELKGKKITYQNSGGKTLEYTLPPEEAAYCAKYNFSETQVQRFAKLRNEYFAQESVRNSGIETKFEIQDILDWVKKDASDQDIFNYNYFLNNPQLFVINNEALGKNYTERLLRCLFLNKNFKLRPEFEQKAIIADKIVSKLMNKDYMTFLEQTYGKEIAPGKIFIEPEILLNSMVERFSDEKLVLDCCKKVIQELKASQNLTEYELNYANKILSYEYKKGSIKGKELLKEISLVFDYGIHTQEQMNRFKQLIQLGVDNGVEYIASNKKLFDTIMRLTKDESLVFEDLNGNIQRLEVRDLAILSQFIDLTKFNLKPLLQNGLSKWSKVCTGENEGVHKVFESAKSILRNGTREITPNLTSEDISKISRIGTEPALYRESLKLENGNLIFNDGQYGFKAAVQKIEVEGRPVLLIKDIEKEGYYIAHDGAITKLNDLPNIDRDKLQKSLFGFSKYSKKQDEIYADAIEHFPIRIIDNNSECIIGKGLRALGIEPIALQMTDSEFISHYQKTLRILKDTGNLSVNNILRIMPNFATIQVNPYTTGRNGKMLYSISAEWKSADGVKWQLRTHSTDLGHYMNSGNSAENSDWVFRLGHEENGVAKFFEWNEVERKFTPTGDFFGKTSHIQIPHSPFTEEGNLLDNIHFQNIMRQISTNIV